MVPHSFLLLGRKEHRDFTLSLREVAALLPITGTAHSRRITKAARERCVTGGGDYGAESRWDDTNGAGLSDWPVLHNTDSSSPCPSSQDSEWSCRQTPGATATPTSSSPLRTLCFGDFLNLSPSLLTSPARDLALSFLQEGQENLHVLFEDVWVNAMHSSESQEHSTDNTAEVRGEERRGEGVFVLLPSPDSVFWGGSEPLPLPPHLSSAGPGTELPAGGAGEPARSHPGIPSTVVTKKLAGQ
ncbi:UNVERIFIED_CONTAM: hypothetical protein FKN15_029197 [Acipenser sinensis]